LGTIPPKEWEESKNIISEEVAREAFRKMTDSSCKWLPDILNAEYIDYLATTRVVLPFSETSDRRPSVIEKLPLNSPFYTVFSGKVDHSIWVANEIKALLQADLEAKR